jgi:hypothetical protein
MRDLGGDLALALDPGVWGSRVLSIPFDAQQLRFLRSPAKRFALNCHRQWGKSTVMAARSVHRMIYQPPWLVVAISPSARQSAELVRKAEAFAGLAGVSFKGDGDNPVSMVFPNGSRLVGLPDAEGRIRGFSSVHDLLVDEASRVGDDTYKACRPMVAAVDGNISLVSTPFGKRGFFHKACEVDPEYWERLNVSAEDSGRFSRAYLAEEMRELGPLWYPQEYGCAFIDATTSIFSHQMLLGAIRPGLEPLSL